MPEEKNRIPQVVPMVPSSVGHNTILPSLHNRKIWSNSLTKDLVLLTIDT